MLNLLFVTNLLPKCGERPLTAAIRLENVLNVSLVHPGFARLVKAVVGQVHVCFLEVRSVGLLVLSSAEAGKPLLVNEAVHLAVSHTSNDDKYTEIELVAFHKKWVGEVTLDNHLLGSALGHVAKLLKDAHAIALAATLRFRDENGVRVFLLICVESLLVLREDKRARHEVVLVGVFAFSGDAHHRLKVVFASQLFNGWWVPVDEAT